jgi:hypothetical protein
MGKAELEAKRLRDIRKQWFIDRIGKRVFRPAGTCNCNACRRVERDGLVIEDKNHAEYLLDVEGCSGMKEGEMPWRYFDTPEEVATYVEKYKSHWTATKNVFLFWNKLLKKT